VSDGIGIGHFEASLLEIVAVIEFRAADKKSALGIKSAVEVSDEAVEAMLAGSLEHAFEDMDARIFTEARLKAEEMLPAVETALEQLATELPEDEITLIRHQAHEVSAALAGKETLRLKKALTNLDNATQSLATRLIEKAMKTSS
jgi:molecular chaperone DnaK